MLHTANKINKDPNQFALITDLTGIIQIGDLIIQSPESQKIVEVKIGEKNEESFRVIEFYQANNIEITEELLSKFSDQTFTDQVLRILKQKEKLSRVKTILKDNIAIDPKVPDITVILPDSLYIEETYHEEIFKLLETLEHKDWGYTNIEDVINIGVYKGNFRSVGKKINF